jgi:hypothetical protein
VFALSPANVLDDLFRQIGCRRPGFGDKVAPRARRSRRWRCIQQNPGPRFQIDRHHPLGTVSFVPCLQPGSPALVIGLLSAPWASGALANGSSKTLDLTGVVTEVQKHRVGDEFEVHSTIDLLSGSKSAGTFDTNDCSAVLIDFLVCGGKASVNELGSGLDFHIEWPCPENGLSPCSSVGHGILSKRAKTIATLKVKTSFPDFMKLHERFPLVIQTKG